MKTQLQDINSIAPVSNSANPVKSTDPVRADYEEGKRLFANGEYAQAAAAMHNALLGYEEKGEEVGIANASNHLGHICLAREDFEQASKHYQRAWDICEKLQDSMSLVALEKQFVLVYRGLKLYRRAIDVCLSLLDRYHANNNPQGAVTVLVDMAEIYLESGQKDKAADAYRTVASIHSNFKHNTIAETFVKKAKELEEAA